MVPAGVSLVAVVHIGKGALSVGPVADHSPRHAYAGSLAALVQLLGLLGRLECLDSLGPLVGHVVPVGEGLDAPGPKRLELAQAGLPDLRQFFHQAAADAPNFLR